MQIDHIAIVSHYLLIILKRMVLHERNHMGIILSVLNHRGNKIAFILQ